MIDKDIQLEIIFNTKGECKKSGEIRSKTYNRVKVEEITPLPKWEAILKTEIPWLDVFQCLYQTTSTNKLREFQYKLIHRIATSRYMRKKMKIDSSDLCHMCEVNVETLEHQQLNCVYTKRFRELLETRLVAKIPENRSQAVDLITCGGTNKCVSYLRLVVNQYISKKFHKQKKLWWDEYKSWVKKGLKYEKELSAEEKQTVLEIIS